MKILPHDKSFGRGLWSDVPMSDYLAVTSMSSSQLRTFMKSPLTYRRAVEGISEDSPTKAQSLGTRIHSAVLEDRFNYTIKPAVYGPEMKKWNANATECKAWLQDHPNAVSVADDKKIRAAALYVADHPKAGPLLRGGVSEVSAFNNGYRARFDMIKIYLEDTAVVVDLKTCDDASEKAFARSLFHWGYHVQAAWYRRILKDLGFREVNFYFIALQTGLPLVNVFRMSAKAMDLADKQTNDALLMLKRCEDTAHWPEWPDYDGTETIKEIDIPTYCYGEGEIEIEMGGETVTV